MANSRTDNCLAQTIIYLRPQRSEAIAALDFADNERYQVEVAPPSEPIDLPLDGISEDRPPCPLSPHDGDHNSVSGESTSSLSSLYPICPRVFRLGFDSNDVSIRGFIFGSSPDSDVKLCYDVEKPRDKGRKYFRIHYNYISGALLITAIRNIIVGQAYLDPNQCLVLMPSTRIYCGRGFEVAVEFPDLSSCAKEHAQNYQKYAARLGVSNAQYLPTPRLHSLFIGTEHRSLAILGEGAFGQVHEAINIKDGRRVAIKILSEGGEREMNEVNIISNLDHVSSLVDVLCRILTYEKENIIKYEGGFRLYSGQICIVMELAVNDLNKHQIARKNGRGRSYLSLQCIQSISRQALSALCYLHSKDITHRDLKPTNILVTNWDADTDIPTIKLADFGLAAISSRHTTFCGTEGYIAPEVKRLEEFRKAEYKDVMSFPRSSLLSYDKSADIWTLGKILQDLIEDVPSSSTRRKTVPVSKELALRLIRQMMHQDPQKRPTAADCLDDPWVRTVNSDSLPAQKRNRSPTSTPEQSFKRMAVMNAMADESEYQNVLHGLSAPFNIGMEDSQATQLAIRFREGDTSHYRYSTQMHESQIIIPSVILPDDAIGSSTRSSQLNKGVTFPSNYDDVMADISYG